MTVRETLAEGTLYIPRRDAELLLARVLRRPRTWVLSYPEVSVSVDLGADFNDLVRRRDRGEPLQYLLGRQEFFGLSLQVTPDVLIPRPETEHLVEAVLAWAEAQQREAEAQRPAAGRQRSAAEPLRLVDVGTGSGAIALALAAHLPAKLPASAANAEITAVDLSPSALEVARSNAEQLGLSGRVRFLQSDLLSVLDPELAAGLRLDAVVSNPPYVPLGDAAAMQREVVEHEPHLALFGGADGLDVYRRLLPAAHGALRPGGMLAVEFGFGQAHALAALLGSGWTNLRFQQDYAGIDRLALAERA